MDDQFYIPAKFKEQRVNVVLSTPIALVPGAEGGVGQVAIGTAATLVDIAPTSIVIRTDEGSIFGPPGDYAVMKKALLSCGTLNKVASAGPMSDADLERLKKTVTLR